MLRWVVIIVVVGVLYILNREIYFYEGARLGFKIQGRLYDRWAAKYDKDKQDSQQQDAEILVHPLLERLDGLKDIQLLDIATGTGRLPLALFREPDFQGHIIAADISTGMLVQATEKLAPFVDHIEFLKHPAAPLPFADQTFDVVSCVEAMVIMPDIEQPIAEFARVLRPGGVLLTTNSTEKYASSGKKISPQEFEKLLASYGFEDIAIIPWWKKFNRVLARKPGQLTPATSTQLLDILTCPNCQNSTAAPTTQEAGWQRSEQSPGAEETPSYQCQQCGLSVFVDENGIYKIGATTG